MIFRSFSQRDHHHRDHRHHRDLMQSLVDEPRHFPSSPTVEVPSLRSSKISIPSISRLIHFQIGSFTKPCARIYSVSNQLRLIRFKSVEINSNHLLPRNPFIKQIDLDTCLSGFLGREAHSSQETCASFLVATHATLFRFENTPSSMRILFINASFFARSRIFIHKSCSFFNHPRVTHVKFLMRNIFDVRLSSTSHASKKLFHPRIFSQ